MNYKVGEELVIDDGCKLSTVKITDVKNYGNGDMIRLGGNENYVSENFLFERQLVRR